MIYYSGMAKNFRDAFLEALDASGTSMADVARNTGVSVEQLKKIKQRPAARTNIDDAIRIAHFFGKSVESFISNPAIEAPLRLIGTYYKIPAEKRPELESFAKGLQCGSD